MNHLCKENDTGKEGNIGAAFKDDPRQGARLSDSKRKEIEAKPRDTSPKKGVLDDNMSNDPRTPADTIRKDGKQPDKVIDRKNGVGDDNMSNGPRTPANAIRKDGQQTERAINRKDGLVDDNIISDDKRSYDPCTHANAIKKK